VISRIKVMPAPRPARLTVNHAAAASAGGGMVGVAAIVAGALGVGELAAAAIVAGAAAVPGLLHGLVAAGGVHGVALQLWRGRR
jgi:hypothetical protein